MPVARRKCKRKKRSIFGNDILIRCLQVDQDPRQYHRLFEQGEVESHQPLFKGDTIETTSDFTDIKSQGQGTQIGMFKEC